MTITESTLKLVCDQRLTGAEGAVDPDQHLLRGYRWVVRALSFERNPGNCRARRHVSALRHKRGVASGPTRAADGVALDGRSFCATCIALSTVTAGTVVEVGWDGLASKKGDLTMRSQLARRLLVGLVAGGVCVSLPGAATADVYPPPAEIHASDGWLSDGGNTVTVTLSVRCPPGYLIDYPELNLTQTRGGDTTTGQEASGQTLRNCPRGLALATATDVGTVPFRWGPAKATVGVLVWLPGVTTVLREQIVTKTIWLW